MEKRSAVEVRSAEKSSTDFLSTCRASIALLAGQREWTDTRESWLARAADRSGLSNRTIKSLYYGDITDADHPAVKKLQRAARAYETEDLASRIEALARSLRARSRGRAIHQDDPPES